MNDTRADLSELQRQSLQSSFLDLERRLTDIEAAMFAVEHRSPLSKYDLDLTPVEMGVVRDYCQRIRTAMLDLLAEQEIEVRIRRVGLRWSLLTHAAYLHVAVSDISADRLRGYGPVSEQGRIAVDRLSQRLDVLVDQLDSFLRERPDDLKRRLAHSSAPAELSRIVATTAEIVTRQGLVEYRPKLNALLDRLERADLEIALFGRVSSGKSSLLNHIAGTDVLPVGVTPITAVPTRLTWGESPLGRIAFAESPPRQIDVAEVAAFASEENNPGNIKRVTRIEVQIPSERLHKGVVFVDTPGVGSLARQGSSETFEYLPRCDLGVVLIDASSTLNEDDILLIHRLRDSGAAVQVLLSKVDLLSPGGQKRMVDYLVQRLAERFQDAVPVFPVSVMKGYEALWQQWFEQQVMPNQRDRQKLASQSLFRKTLRLVEAVRATLDSRLNKRASIGNTAEEHVEQVRQLLSRGDDVIGELNFQTVRWRDKLRTAEEQVIEQVAGKLVMGTSSQGSMQDVLSSTLQQVLQKPLGAGSKNRRRSQGTAFRNDWPDPCRFRRTGNRSRRDRRSFVAQPACSRGTSMGLGGAAGNSLVEQSRAPDGTLGDHSVAARATRPAHELGECRPPPGAGTLAENRRHAPPADL
ncbi:MAG: dynamin family protein [Aureliella sp.]